MGVSTRVIRRRIKSVRNTRKITKAMELVAASKMRRAVQAVLLTRPYARLAMETVRSVSRLTDVHLHPLLRQNGETKRTLFILLTSDRGLAGGFNANIFRKFLVALKEMPTDSSIDIVAVGKRGADAVRRLHKNMVATFVNMANHPRFEDTLPISRLAMEAFSKGEYDKVVLGYTDFVSAVSQQPVLVDLLPFTFLKSEPTQGNQREFATEYVFEPSPADVLGRLLPHLVQTAVYQAILESAASEHSARMMTMRSASDAATEMIDNLTFVSNQIRQAGITNEIAEISSGKAALESL